MSGYTAFRQQAKFTGITTTAPRVQKLLYELFIDRGVGKDLTEQFYSALESVPEAVALLQGRVDKLKKTHALWLESLLRANYDEEYFDSRYRIGQVHVRVGVPPRFVSMIMSFLRLRGIEAIIHGLPNDAAPCAASWVMKLDLDLMAIEMAYHQTRLDRLSDVTGMAPALLENLIKISDS